MDRRAARDLLTPREIEVLELMARGLTNGQIAEQLGISFATAKTHVSDIIGRLGVSSREEAIARWRAEQSARGRIWRQLAVVPTGWLGFKPLLGSGAALALRWRRWGPSRFSFARRNPPPW